MNSEFLIRPYSFPILITIAMQNKNVIISCETELLTYCIPIFICCIISNLTTLTLHVCK